VTCHRFGPRRLDAATFTKLNYKSCDRSQPTKAVTGHRTPKETPIDSEPTLK
jgi:hypothetical protein